MSLQDTTYFTVNKIAVCESPPRFAQYFSTGTGHPIHGLVYPINIYLDKDGDDSRGFKNHPRGPHFTYHLDQQSELVVGSYRPRERAVLAQSLVMAHDYEMDETLRQVLRPAWQNRAPKRSNSRARLPNWEGWAMVTS